MLYALTKYDVLVSVSLQSDRNDIAFGQSIAFSALSAYSINKLSPFFLYLSTRHVVKYSHKAAEMLMLWGGLGFRCEPARVFWGEIIDLGWGLYRF